MALKQGVLLHNNTYRIELVLGQGGFGITYLAIHVRLKKNVAIKEFFPKSLCSRDSYTNCIKTDTDANVQLVEKLRNKFLKEAEHIAEMESPYIVRIADVFEENGTAYYVMDYIEGKSLSDVVNANGPLSEQQAIKYITKIGEALAYIHSKRMNHLDVKPANIMIRERDNIPILVDFGLSKQYDTNGCQTSTTPVGISHGYAPIEQYNSEGVKDFSLQTDLYSLAATLYYLLSGKTPSPAPKLIEEGLSFPSSIPHNLIPIISKAMAANRKERYKTVNAFLNDLTSLKDETIIQDNNNCKYIPLKKKNVQNNDLYSLKHQKKVSDTKPKTKFFVRWTIYIMILIVIIFSIIYILQSMISPESTAKENNTILVDTVETEAVLNNNQEDIMEQTGAPLSDGEKEDGRGGYDDNAEGYFNMYSDTYVTSNNDVYFEGNFTDNKGKYPISLKFEFDDNWHASVCYYHNIDYNTKLKMSVRFTEEQMIITGNAGGCNFVMTLSPTIDGKWEGTAQNGNHKLTANIWPIQMP